ncbi:hypothetical protein HN865_03010 [Candidatus Woesearchaeota archaeon]|jgi:hypothetical protein|nr:hypothetical protein [Candidatus Woesearchaeota archaeon]MBT7237803.1 hypothetical protein [Candidatus Woesearchaeota archaeon]
MVKVHTRMKRRLGISTHKSGNVSTVAKKKGPKTFPSEDSAKAYAAEQGIKDFELKKVKKGLRFQIISK